MRPRLFVLFAFLCILFVAIPVRAQFQEPTKEELQMTSDPAAPGADAVYLYREDVTDDQLHSRMYYERIKVLTERGKELATVRIPYVHGMDKVADIHARTIHADGTVVPLTAKPEDLMESKTKGFQVNQIVMTLPSVEVGSILEYRLTVRMPDTRVSMPLWDVQQPFYTHKVHYSFHPHLAGNEYVSDGHGNSLNRLLYSVRLPRLEKLDVNERKALYSLDLKDVPPIPEEDWMPPLNTLRWRVEFYFANESTGPEFWKNAGRNWGKETSEFTEVTGKLKRAAAEIVPLSAPDEEKARKIYAAVQKLDNTVFSRKKSQAERKAEKLRDVRTVEDVWKQQAGSDDDMARLYVALARAAGLKAYAAQVVDRSRAMFDEAFLSAKQLDDFLAIVVINGKEVFLDPGQKMCPFGMLHWKHTYASGLRILENGQVGPVSTPAATYKAAVVQRVGDLQIAADGSVKGTVRFIMTGPDALRWRQMALDNDPDEVKKSFNESIKGDLPDGISAEFDHFLGLEDYDNNLLAFVKVTGAMGSATGKRFFLPAAFFEARSKHPFSAVEKRLTPIDVHYPKMVQDDVVYHLPEGYTVETAPQETNTSWPNHAVMTLKCEAAGDRARVQRTLAYAYTLLVPGDYPGVRDFYQKVATADGQQLVLTRTQTAKGN